MPVSRKSKLISLLMLSLISLSPVANANVFVNPRSVNLNLYVGKLNADEETGVLEGSNSEVALGLASSSQSRRYPSLSLDFELWALSSEYKNTLPPPLFVDINDEMVLDTSALTIGARFNFPHDTPYRLYISGGYGYFLSTMRVYANMLGVPGYFEDTSRDFAPYLGAGATFDIGYRQTLELFYRKWEIEGDFSDFGIPKTELGGEAFGIGFGMYW